MKSFEQRDPEPDARSETNLSDAVTPMPPSVNYHLWQPCNMRCHYCFATFEDVRADVVPKGHLPREEAESLVRAIAPFFEKITFAGGEPTLCPWLASLIQCARELGMTTMLVTNGTRIDEQRLAALAPALDWLALSVDSANETTHRALGRAVRGRPLPASRFVRIADAARALGVRLKLNTVVTTLNAGEDMTSLLAALRPERWKILRALPVAGQNDGPIEPLLVDDAAFHAFVTRHEAVQSLGVTIATEDNDAMRGSYAMIDPAGRFFDNVDGRHHYSAPILSAGVRRAWSEVRFSLSRFRDRGGDYDFRRRP